MLDYARAGDTVVVTAIDRLGRSVAEITRTIAELVERRILLHALREGIDTATPTGRAVAAIMATLAELELELGRERRAASRASRRSRQLPATKPHKLTADRQEQLRRLAATGEPVPELAKAFGMGRGTAYRYLADDAVAHRSNGSRCPTRATPPPWSGRARWPGYCRVHAANASTSSKPATTQSWNTS
jgi:DNA invertase Pin-like site-specific DNA recombinase